MNIAPKTAAVGLGGSLSVILLWIAGLALAHWQITIPPEIAGAFTTLLSTLAPYYAPRSQHPSDSGQTVGDIPPQDPPPPQPENQNWNTQK